MEGFACHAEEFGLYPVGNREPREVSKQGDDMFRCVKELPATEPWPGMRGDRSPRETSWEVATLLLSLA